MPEPLVRYMDSRGRDKVMWSSYFPIMTVERTLREGRDLPLRPEAMAGYLGDNAARVFGTPEAALATEFVGTFRLDEHASKHLSRRVAGELVGEVPDARDLVARQLLARVGEEVIGRRRIVGVDRDDPRMRRAAQSSIGHAGDGHLGHGGMRTRSPARPPPDTPCHRRG